MTPLTLHHAKNVRVIRSFYMTFDGKRCTCKITRFSVNRNAAFMHVSYGANDEENYSLSSEDGIRYRGAYLGTNDDSRVEFVKFQRNDELVMAGIWKCGGREGEWYIEGVVKDESRPE